MNYCRFFSKLATCATIVAASCSNFAFAAPSEPRIPWGPDEYYYMGKDIFKGEIDDAKQKQECVKKLEKKKKEVYANLRTAHWAGGKKIASMPDFYLVWTLDNWKSEDHEQIKEAFQFMQKLQPRLRKELGVFLLICARNDKAEKKVLATMSEAGAKIPVTNFHGRDGRYQYLYLYPASQATSLVVICPFTDLDDSEAVDVYFKSFEKGVKDINDWFENKLGELYTPHFAPTYSRIHKK